MATPTVENADALRNTLSGPVLLPRDLGYDDARRVHNGLVDKYPAIIARCRTTADVVSAVNFGRESQMEMSVRGGGHNIAGKAVTEGGLMIDLSLMKAVEVDPTGQTIRAEPGVTWGELNEVAHAHGLATTGGVISTTGIAGLTLGGGIGWNMGRYGTVVDNLASAEVVLANGDVVTAGNDDDADLFWAIRGGGGNFGIATSFTYHAYPLTTVLGGAVAHPLEAGPRVLRFYREFASSLPDDLTVYAPFRFAPDGSGTALSLIGVCHVGDEKTARAEVQPLRDFGPPVADLVDRIPYPVLNTLIDDVFPKGKKNYWKSAFFAELSDDAIDAIVAAFGKAPTEWCTLIVEHLHGAATRIDRTATAFPHRSPGFNLIIASQWSDDAQTTQGMAWARETFDALRPYMADQVYVNYMDADDEARVRAAYGPNYERLVEIKRRYDPDNIFRLNMNVRP